MSQLSQNDIKFVESVSKKGTPILYIKILKKYELLEKDISILKKICGGIFFYSPKHKMWGFTNRKEHLKNVKQFLVDKVIPAYIRDEILDEFKAAIKSEKKDIDTTYRIRFIEVNGRPLYYTEMNNGNVVITINIAHWFFENKSNDEKNIITKFVLSIVKTERQFTSEMIDQFMMRLHISQQIEFDHEFIR